MLKISLNKSFLLNLSPITIPPKIYKKYYVLINQLKYTGFYLKKIGQKNCCYSFYTVKIKNIGVQKTLSERVLGVRIARHFLSESGLTAEIITSLRNQISNVFSPEM